MVGGGPKGGQKMVVAPFGTTTMERNGANEGSGGVRQKRRIPSGSLKEPPLWRPLHAPCQKYTRANIRPSVLMRD